MKKLLSKLIFCFVVCLSCLSYSFIQTTSTSDTSSISQNITEITQSKDKMVSSVNKATVIVHKIVDVLAHRNG